MPVSISTSKKLSRWQREKKEALKRVPMTESSFIHGIFKKRFRANKSPGNELVVVTRMFANKTNGGKTKFKKDKKKKKKRTIVPDRIGKSSKTHK